MKFNIYNVVDLKKGIKQKVSYSKDGRQDRRECITLYERGYENNLAKIFPHDSQNNSDPQIDYYETTKVTIYKGQSLYKDALKAFKKAQAKHLA